MAVLFVSDLHLDPAQPAHIADFAHFCATRARSATCLYILGDLFEAWTGDDEDDPALMPVLDAIADLTRSGVRCRFMHGNRDFLVGEQFAALTGVELLGDHERIEINGEPVLLMHGDLLCTDDTRYLELRSQLRSPAWQRDFLAKPLSERRRIAAELRALSKSEMAGKSEAIMDVNAAAVQDTMRAHDVRILVHGHTHRPAIHRFELDGKEAMRIVLTDWYAAGGYLSWSTAGPALRALPASERAEATED